MNIHVSNFDLYLQDNDLKTLFTPYGTVQSAEVSMDAFTDKSRGFGYVEMPNEDEARAAIAALHKTTLNGRTLGVQEAPPKDVRKGSYKVGTTVVNPFPFKRQ